MQQNAQPYVKALLLERCSAWDDASPCWRALILKINKETGLASVVDIAEHVDAEEAMSFVCAPHDDPIGVKVDSAHVASGQATDAVQYGSHLVVWPDAISTIETALAIYAH